MGSFNRIKTMVKKIMPPHQYIYFREKWRAINKWTAKNRDLYQDFRLFPILCNPTKISLDIGANAGVYLYYMIKYSKECYAFEPNPQLAMFLEQAFSRKNTRVYRYALSDHEGTDILRIPTENSGLATIESDNKLDTVSSYDRVLVECKRLDDLEIYNIGFIKVDTEGHEYAMLMGAAKTISREKPNLLLELEERHKPGIVKTVSDYLIIKLGYRGFFIENYELVEIDKFQPDKHQNIQKIYTASYANNFIFVHNSSEAYRMILDSKP